jgi:hypothetical protein
MIHTKAALPLVAGLFWLCRASQPISIDPRIIEIKATVKDIGSHLKELNKSRLML